MIIIERLSGSNKIKIVGGSTPHFSKAERFSYKGVTGRLSYV